MNLKPAPNYEQPATLTPDTPMMLRLAETVEQREQRLAADPLVQMLRGLGIKAPGESGE